MCTLLSTWREVLGSWGRSTMVRLCPCVVLCISVHRGMTPRLNTWEQGQAGITIQDFGKNRIDVPMTLPNIWNGYLYVARSQSSDTGGGVSHRVVPVASVRFGKWTQNTIACCPPATLCCAFIHARHVTTLSQQPD